MASSSFKSVSPGQSGSEDQQRPSAEIVDHPRRFHRLRRAVGEMGHALDHQQREVHAWRQSHQSLAESVQTFEAMCDAYLCRLEKLSVQNRRLRGKAVRLQTIMGGFLNNAS